MKLLRLILLAMLLAPCAALPTPALAQDDTLAVDRAVFEAVIRDLADSIPEVLLADVRAVRSDQHPALLMLFHPEDLEAPDPVLEASRTSALESLGVERTHILQDVRCFWGGPTPRHDPPSNAPTGRRRADLRPPPRPHPDSVAAVRRACQARPPFVALAIGRPQPVEDTGGTDVRVTVVRAGPSMYGFHYFTLRRDESGGWSVIDRHLIFKAG